MITLYYAPGAASLVVHWLLIELDLPHELRKVDTDAGENKQPGYLAINPAGVVPALVVDGRSLLEAAAIALQLADEHPKAQLAPAIGTPARALYYQWMLTCANTLQPAYRAWFYPTEPAGPEHVDVVKDQARRRVEATWARFDEHLAQHGPYLLGDRLSAADFMTTMLMRWSRNMPKPAHTWPAVGRLAALMKARPSFAELYRRESLTEWS